MGLRDSSCRNCWRSVGVPARPAAAWRQAAPYCGNCGRRESCGGCHRYAPGTANKAAPAAMLLPVTAGLFWAALYALLG